MALLAGLVVLLGLLAPTASADKRVASFSIFAANDTTCKGTPQALGVYQYVTMEPGVCASFIITFGVRASSDFKRIDLFTLPSPFNVTCAGKPNATLTEGACFQYYGGIHLKYTLLPLSAADDDLCAITMATHLAPNCTESVFHTQEFTMKHAQCTAAIAFGSGFFKVDCENRVLRAYANATCPEGSLLGRVGDGQCARADQIAEAGDTHQSVRVAFLDDGAGGKLASWLSFFFLFFSSSMFL
jgi:hypothetical protein